MISKILSMAPEHALSVLTCKQIPRFSLISRLASDCVNLMFPTAPERSRSPPSQIWLNVTCRLGAERGFLAELRREQEPSGSVCLSVCLSAAAVSVCLGHTHTHTKTLVLSASTVWTRHQRLWIHRCPPPVFTTEGRYPVGCSSAHRGGGGGGGIPTILRLPGEIIIILCHNVLWVEVGIVWREEAGVGGRRFGGTGSGWERRLAC